MPRPGSNSMATVSFLSGLVGWIITLLTICANVLVVALAAATAGIASTLGVCTAVIACVSPITWLIGIITGHIAKGQIARTGEAGGGSATMGLLMSYLGLGLMLLSICVLAILAATGMAISIPFLTDPSYWNY
jgi:hypothetical protein